MIVSLVVASIVILSAIVLSKVSAKLGVSSLLIFLALGMFFGSDGPVGIQFADFVLTEQLCTIGLIFIMFYGGFGMSWKAARPVAGQAILLSSAGTIVTGVIVGIFTHYVLKFGLAESFLLGALISSTDAASVFSILRQRKLNLKNGLASLLEMESGSNDPFAYLLTIVGLSLVAAGIQGGELALVVGKQLIFGAVIGFGLAWLAIQITKRFTFSDEGYDALFLLAVALLAYGLPSLIDGNGYLAVYIAGVMIGNTHLANKTNIVHFFDGLTHLWQIVIFFIFGLFAFPSRLPDTFLPALVVFAVLTFVARPLGMLAFLAPFKRSVREITLVSAAGLRGAASLVFAVIALSALTKAGSPISFDIYHIVFWIVLFSIALQGTVLAPIARSLDLVDDSDSVMKTFTDYIDEHDFTLYEIPVKAGGLLANKPLREVELPHQGLAILVKRDKQRILPQGNTVLKANDHLVVAAPNLNNNDLDDLELNEVKLTAKHPWFGKQIRQIDLEQDALVVLVKKPNGKALIPSGNTLLEASDTLVISNHSSLAEGVD